MTGLGDLKQLATRELTAYDYVYQIKRLASPKVSSPIYGLMSEYIVGLSELATELKGTSLDSFVDLRKYQLKGVKVIDTYHYQIKVKGAYAQFYTGLLCHFSPMPVEADRFYSQEGMEEKNLTLDWYPIGTGAYLMEKNDPNQEMILAENPNFHQEFYPSEGEKGDNEKAFSRMLARSFQ